MISASHRFGLPPLANDPVAGGEDLEEGEGEGEGEGLRFSCVWLALLFDSLRVILPLILGLHHTGVMASPPCAFMALLVIPASVTWTS